MLSLTARHVSIEHACIGVQVAPRPDGLLAILPSCSAVKKASPERDL